MVSTETKAAEAKGTTNGNLWIHTTLVYVALFGLGSLSGYGLFWSIFSHRCETFLDEIERAHSNTVTSLNERYQQAVEDRKLCADDESRSQDIFELKGRLEAQSDLVSSHRSLIDKHKISTNRLEEIKTELERKEAELFVVQKRIDLHSREKSAEREMLKHVQSRHSVMSRQFFGRGPYYVKFSLNLPEQGDSFFVLEIASRKALPLSVFTILTLVESAFYPGLDLVIGGEGMLQIGGRASDNDMEEKLKLLGFLPRSPLYFEEQSPSHPCKEGAVSFDNRGPGLILHTRDHGHEYGSCFGEVVHGKDDVVPIIQASLRRGLSLKLSAATVLLENDEI